MSTALSTAKRATTVPDIAHGSRRRLAWLGAPLLASVSSLLPGAAGCSRQERQLLDTEGRRYTALCNERGCKLSSAAAQGNARELSLFAAGRIVGVCTKPAGEVRAPTACRALVCENDTGCPPAHGLDHGTCVNGLCTEPANRIEVSDAIMLCLAGTGWTENSPAQIERYALALNCGSPCRVPSPCRQP